MSDKRNEIVQGSLQYIKSFMDKVDSAKDTVEFCEILASINLFHTFVIKYFEGLFLQDGTKAELDAFLGVIQEESNQMVKDVLKRWADKNIN